MRESSGIGHALQSCQRLSGADVDLGGKRWDEEEISEESVLH